MTFTIVGQGLAGTWLAWVLSNEGHLVRIVDPQVAQTASRVAAGIVNPLTGQRVKPTWRGDTLIPQARAAFREFERAINAHETAVGTNAHETAFGTQVWRDIELRRVFRDEATQQWFEKRMASGELNSMRVSRIRQGEFDGISYPHGGCIVHDAALIDVPSFLDKGRAALQRKGADIVRASVDLHDVDAIAWDSSHMSDIVVWCIGIDALKHPLWSWLTLEPSKGEILEVVMLPAEGDIDTPPMNYILNSGTWIAPLANGRYLVGATNDWDDHVPTPTEQARRTLIDDAQRMTGRTFDIVDHRAAIRPSTLRKRPLIGRHPVDSRHAILTGLGTKGCQLAPWAARQIVDHLLNDTPLDPEVDITQDFKDV